MSKRSSTRASSFNLGPKLPWPTIPSLLQVKNLQKTQDKISSERYGKLQKKKFRFRKQTPKHSHHQGTGDAQPSLAKRQNLKSKAF